MGTVSADLASSGVGGRRSRCEPGATQVAPPGPVMPSQAKQNVTTKLCSGNGVGIQFWSEWSASPASPSPSNFSLMLPTMRPARMALPTLNSANAITFGNVATRSTAGARPSSMCAPPTMPLPRPLTGVANLWMASRKSSISSGGAASRMIA